MTEFPMIVSMIIIPLSVAMCAAADGDEADIDYSRVKTIAPMLPSEPYAVGNPISDRSAWSELAELDAFKRVIERAEDPADKPIPDQPDELYLDFSRTGNRTRWQRVANRRRKRVTTFALAECLENNGRFIEPFEKIVDALCAEPTWVMPAHDRDLENFHGEQTDIDLASSAMGWTMATANYLLGDKLSEGCRRKIAENVRRRVLKPFRRMYLGEREHNWWMHTTNNWNAVCLAGVTGAALAQIPDRKMRAEYVAAAEKYSKNFLRGFTEDGYCTEGLGYWNYGFGHYVLLSETIYQATEGGVDLLGRPKAQMPAQFPFRIEIMSGISPAFADCGVGAKPSLRTMWYLNRRFGFGLNEYRRIDPQHKIGKLPATMIYAFDNSVSDSEVGRAGGEEVGIRTWFDDAAILIGRPAVDSDCKLGVALKGGHNAEHHNHNDVGSYVVVCEDRAVLLDPGSEVYTKRTFSSRRYESKLLNSFGHPVPIVAGKLQQTGKDARAEVISTDFTEAADTLKLDISSAYDVGELEKLQRTFVYSRGGDGALTVTDSVQFSEPQSFATALITRGDWERLDDGSIVVYDFNQTVSVHIDAGGIEFEIETEKIEENAKVHPTGLGIKLVEPVNEATVTTQIQPTESFAEDARSGLLLNGKFEYGAWGWKTGDEIGNISAQRAYSGEKSLKIEDDSADAGSNITSAPIKVDGSGKFTISGRAYHVSGEGIGIYIRMYDADGNMLNETNERGWISPVGTLSAPEDQWAPFEFDFETPADTDNICVWIHSYNAAKVTAYIDDLKIETEK